MHVRVRCWFHLWTMPHCDRSTDILLFLILCCLFSFGYKWKMIGSFSLIPMFITNNSMHALLVWLSLLRFVYLFSSVAYFLFRSHIFLFGHIFLIKLDILCIVNCMEIILIKTMNGLNLEFDEWEERTKSHTHILPTLNWIRCSQNGIAACWLDWSTSTLWE